MEMPPRWKQWLELMELLSSRLQDKSALGHSRAWPKGWGSGQGPKDSSLVATGVGQHQGPVALSSWGSLPKPDSGQAVIKGVLLHVVGPGG